MALLLGGMRVMALLLGGMRVMAPILEGDTGHKRAACVLWDHERYHP